MKMLSAATAVMLFLLSTAGVAQVAQWNHFVQDEKLERAFHLALNQVAIEYLQEMEKQNNPAAILFLDSQKDISLLLTSSNFRHELLAASRAKANFIIDYQALSSEGVTVRIGIGFFGKVDNQLVDYGSVDPEISGDGGIMLCPVNNSGLRFMYGALTITSLDDTGRIRVTEDAADIKRKRARILARTYENYGHVPAE